MRRLRESNPLVAFAVTLAIALVFYLVILPFVLVAYAQGSSPAPKSNLRELLTPDAIFAIAFLVTAPLTALLKRWLKTEDAATVVVNVIANSLAKGAGLYLSGAATLSFALGSAIFGIVLDKALYTILVQTSRKGAEKVIDVQAKSGPSSSLPPTPGQVTATQSFEQRSSGQDPSLPPGGFR